MLSNDLRSLIDFFEACRRDDGSAAITAPGALSFSRALQSCFDQALALEESAVDLSRVREEACEQMLATARLMSATTNVVMIHADRPLWAGDGPRNGGGTA